MFASTELIGHMNKVKDSYNVNSMTQIAGEAALRDRKYFDWLVRSTIAERIWLLENTKQFNWEYPKTDVRGSTPPSLVCALSGVGWRVTLAPLSHFSCAQANFVLFDVGSSTTAEYLYSGLKKQGLLVRYWGSRPDLCSKLRVTVGTRESNERFVNLIADLLAAKKQKQ